MRSLIFLSTSMVRAASQTYPDSVFVDEIVKSGEPDMATATARGATAAAEYPTRMFIDGSWCDALDGKTLAVINPADESVLAAVAYGTRTEADRAIAAAERAFPAWRALSV